jgi:hypothetical protein
MHTPSHDPREVFGVLAEFNDSKALINAARELTQRGYRRFEAYTPFPVEGLAEAMEFRRTGMPLLVLIGGILGAAGGYGLQYWVSAIEYPLNIGGRPYHSWPAFIPITFETTILVASLFAVLGMLALNGLPRPHHPLFAIEEFSAHASTDGYFLCMLARDPKFDEAESMDILKSLNARQVWSVPTYS